MAFSVTILEADLDKAVSKATTYADLADKVADAQAAWVEKLPVVGPDATLVITLLDEVTKALNALNAALHVA
jgi:hypothetical protein